MDLALYEPIYASVRGEIFSYCFVSLLSLFEIYPLRRSVYAMYIRSPLTS